MCINKKINLLLMIHPSIHMEKTNAWLEHKDTRTFLTRMLPWYKHRTKEQELQKVSIGCMI